MEDGRAELWSDGLRDVGLCTVGSEVLPFEACRGVLKTDLLASLLSGGQ